MALGKASNNSERGKSSNTQNDENQRKLDATSSDFCFEEQLDLENYLPEFFIWLEEQIKLDNHPFILEQNPKKSDQPKNNPEKKLIFLFMQLLEQYSDYSGVPAYIIHTALKEALSVTYSYTVQRGNQIIEVTPCLYPLHYNLGDNRLFMV